MNTRFLSLLTISALLLGAAGMSFAQGTAFTYNGRLNDNGNPANGTYDLTFSLFDATNGMNQIGSTLTNNAIGVSGGLFVATLDFGTGIFSGADRWLEIGVRTNGGGAFIALSPRQKLTPTPYAITASNLSGPLPAAQLSGTLSAGQLGGTYSAALTLSNAANIFAGNGSGLTGVDAVTLGGVGRLSFWNLGGNAGTTASNFLGTTHNEPLDLRVNGQRAFRLEPTGDSPNIIGGSSANSAYPGLVGTTISGGGSTDAPNVIGFGGGRAQYATIGGGSGNHMEPSSDYSSIGGGSSNTISAAYGVIGGGRDNGISASSPTCTISGGARNTLYLELSSGGTIGGGEDNRGETAGAGGFYTISGGRSNRILWARSATIGGGGDNAIGLYYSFVNGVEATIGGGSMNSIIADRATIGGGAWNKVNDSGYAGAITGGESNVLNGAYGSINGGSGNAIQTNAQAATIGGGRLNTASGDYSTVPGGNQARASNYGQMAYASGAFASPGDAQTSVFVCRGTTTNATQTDLFLDGVSKRIVVPVNSTWTFDVLVTGRTSLGNSAGYQIRGTIKNNAGNTTLVPSPNGFVELGEDVAAWDATAAADNGNDALVVRVTGAAATTIRWVATVRTVEVNY